MWAAASLTSEQEIRIAQHDWVGYHQRGCLSRPCPSTCIGDSEPNPHAATSQHNCWRDALQGVERGAGRQTQ